MRSASFRALRRLRFRNWLTSLPRPFESDTFAVTLRARLPERTPNGKCGSHPLRRLPVAERDCEESENRLRARATVPGTRPADPRTPNKLRSAAGMSERPTLRCSCLRVWALALLSRCGTTRRYIYLPLPMPQARHITGASPSKCSGPANKHNALLCPTGLIRTVTVAAPDPAPRSNRASTLRHR